MLERAKRKMVLEYASESIQRFFKTRPCLIERISAVINQMDTSQAHLSSKATSVSKDTSKPDNLSKDELTAVLKYGAQKMCVTTVLLSSITY